MRREHFLETMILLILCMSIIPMNLTEMNVAALSRRDFVPKSQNEKIIGHIAMGNWSNGSFLEAVICELIGFNDEAMTIKYRFRHYITRKGNTGSYIYQEVPVSVFLDNKGIAASSGWIDRHIADKIQLCEEKTVTIKSGAHVVELHDIKDGALAVINATKSINISLPSYSVEFLDDDGTVLETQIMERYKGASAPKVSNKTDKTLTGWDKPFQNVRGDLVITVRYVINTYTVSFLDWDGRMLKIQTVSHGGNVSPPSPSTGEGYIFQGWKSDYANVTENRTIITSYKIRTFTITFDSNGDSLVTSQTIIYGNRTGTLADPVEKNNGFVG